MWSTASSSSTIGSGYQRPSRAFVSATFGQPRRVPQSFGAAQGRYPSPDRDASVIVHLFAAAARATTLVNVARALGMEMMLIPQAMIPAVQSMLQPADDDDHPAFTSDVEPEEGQ